MSPCFRRKPVDSSRTTSTFNSIRFILFISSNIVRVTAEMILPNGHNFAVGSDLSITCNVGGDPVPLVKWYKNDVEVVSDNRIRITGKCESTTRHTIPILN